jgi:hypothetical protein
MQASTFDFDVITGPSTPREERDDARTPDQQPTPPAKAESATPRKR